MQTWVTDIMEQFGYIGVFFYDGVGKCISTDTI